MENLENIQGMQIKIKHKNVTEVIDGAGIISEGIYFFSREEFKDMIGKKRSKLEQNSVGEYQKNQTYK